MSRNLCRTDCYYCNQVVVLQEKPRPFRITNSKTYFHEYQDMTVANAECSACEAKYLAWVTPPRHMAVMKADRHLSMPFFDLSFRSTFNDEPGPDDLPKWDISWEMIKKPFDRSKDPYAQIFDNEKKDIEK